MCQALVGLDRQPMFSEVSEKGLADRRGWRKSGKEKEAQRLTFWVRRPPGGVGVFHAEGWWPKTSCPPSKVCLPWVWKRGMWDVPGFLAGCPGPEAVFKKFVQKNFVRIFRSLARKSLPYHRFRPFFCTLFPIPPYE